MRVTSLGSGSSGNALLVEAGPQRRTKLLIDAGFPGRILAERMRHAGVSPTQLAGVLITHEHTDHILGLPTLKKHYKIPVIADPRTLEAIERIFANGLISDETSSIVEAPAKGALDANAGNTRPLNEDAANANTLNAGTHNMSAPGIGNREGPEYGPLEVGSRRIIGDIEVESFAVSHDAVAPCGYLLRAGGCRVCVAIDSGEVTATMLEAMAQADLLIVESNHDRERLLRGPYPYHLKQRILSPTGHLSNDQAADAILHTWRSDAVRWLWLSHLSRTNNTPKLALSSMISHISAARANLSQVHISVQPPGLGGTWDSAQLWHVPSLWEMQS